jgi:hypothetical protein
MVRTSIIVSLVLVSLFAIGKAIFMIIAIINKSNCEGTESGQCPTFSCPNPTDPGGKGTPATR